MFGPSRPAAATRLRHRAFGTAIAIALAFGITTDGARADDATAWHGLNAQGFSLDKQGRFADAIVPFKQALLACDAAGDEKNHCVSLVASNLCLALIKLGRSAEGVPVCAASISALKRETAVGAAQQLFYGEFFLAHTLQGLHRTKEAAALLQEAVVVGRKSASGIPDDTLGNALTQLALIHRAQGRLKEAAGELRDAVARRRTSNPGQAIQALGWLQETLWELQQDDDAEAAAKEALALARSASPPDASQLIAALSIVAQHDTWAGRLPEAEAATRQCIEIIQKNSQPNDLILAVRRRELADILADERKAGEAMTVERQALAQYQRYAPKATDILVIQNRLAYLEKLAAREQGKPALTSDQLASIAEAEHLSREAALAEGHNQWAQAANFFRKSATLAETVLPPDSQRLGMLLYESGTFFKGQERDAEAAPLLSRAAEIFKTYQPYQIKLYATTLEELGQIYEGLGEPALAEARMRESLARFKEFNLSNTEDAIVALHNYGTFLRDQSRFKAAEDIFRSTLASQSARYGADQPATAGELNSLGLLYLKWGRYAEARTALQRAQAIEDKIGGPPTETKTFILINLASLAAAEGRYAEAEDFHRRALVLREELYGKDSAQAARTLRTIAADELAQWRLPEAEKIARQAIALGVANGDTWRYQTSEAWRLLGHIEASERRPEDALVSMDKAVALDKTLVNAEQRGLINSLFDKAKALFWLGRYQDAVNVADQALSAGRQAFSADAPGPLAATYETAADFRSLAGYPQGATILLQQALAIRIKLSGATSLAAAYDKLHLIPFLLIQGRAQEADALAKEGLAAVEGVFGSDSPKLFPFLIAASNVSSALGRYQAAELTLRRALKELEASLPADSPIIVPTLSKLATNLALQGRAQEAEPYAARALKITEARTGSKGPAMLNPLESMAIVFALEGNASKAVAMGHRAFTVASEVFGPHHPATAEAMRIIGDSLARLPSSHSDAEFFLKGAIAIDKTMPPSVNFWLAADLNDLALIEAADKNLAQAGDHLRQSIAIFNRAGFADSLSLAVVLANLAKVDTELGRKAEAASADQQAVAIFQNCGADRVHRANDL